MYNGCFTVVRNKDSGPLRGGVVPLAVLGGAGCSVLVCFGVLAVLLLADEGVAPM